MSFRNPLLKRIYTTIFLENVLPLRGSIVYRKLGFAEHTGIFIERDHIIQLSGSGRIRRVNFEAFTGGNPFCQIYVACDKHGHVLYHPQIADRALSAVGQSRDYHVLIDNCHQFVSGCITGDFESADNYFILLEFTLEKTFSTEIEWRIIEAPWS